MPDSLVLVCFELVCDRQMCPSLQTPKPQTFFSAFAQTHVLYSFQSLQLTIPTTFIHCTKHFSFPSHMEHQNVHIKEKQMHVVK